LGLAATTVALLGRRCPKQNAEKIYFHLVLQIKECSVKIVYSTQSVRVFGRDVRSKIDFLFGFVWTMVAREWRFLLAFVAEMSSKGTRQSVWATALWTAMTTIYKWKEVESLNAEVKRGVVSAKFFFSTLGQIRASQCL
jgi:hypothetical protein